jgi:hypothetical protein
VRVFKNCFGRLRAGRFSPFSPSPQPSPAGRGGSSRKLLAVMLGLVVPFVAFGKAAYHGKTNMVSSAEVIAVVTISKVESTTAKRKGWTYSEAATAKVEQVLKGSLPRQVVLYGGENFICAQVRYKPGRYIVFLRHDEDLLVGENWHLGVREIKDDNVEWFKDDASLDLKSTKVDEVLKEIAALVKPDKKSANKTAK